MNTLYINIKYQQPSVKKFLLFLLNRLLKDFSATNTIITKTRCRKQCSGPSVESSQRFKEDKRQKEIIIVTKWSFQIDLLAIDDDNDGADIADDVCFCYFITTFF